MNNGDLGEKGQNSKKILEGLFVKVDEKQTPQPKESKKEVEQVLVPKMEKLNVKSNKAKKVSKSPSKKSAEVVQVTPDIVAYLKPKQKDKKKIKKDGKDLYKKFLKGEDLSENDDDDSEYEGDDEASKQQIEFQKSVEKKFFDVKRTKSKETKEIALELHKNRFVDPKKYKDEVVISNHNPTRRLVTAERAVLKASINNLKQSVEQARSSQSIGWRVAKTERRPKGKGRYGNIDLGNREVVDLGVNKVAYRQVITKYPNHLGNYEFEVIGAYGDIIKRLNLITGGDKEIEKYIAQLMYRFAHAGCPIVIDDFKHLKYISTHDINFLNHLNYHLFVKETTRWARSQDADCKFPAATILSYVLELLCLGELNFKDVFSKDAKYNPLTGGFIFISRNEVWNGLNELNKLYQQKILMPKAKKFNPHFFEKHKDKEIQLIATPEYLHKQFLASFGGKEDSDGEDYNELLNIVQGDKNWYTSDEMAALLNHYIQDDDVIKMTPIDLTQHEGATLKDNLQQIKFQTALLDSIGATTRAIVLPILINYNHWVGLVINFNGTMQGRNIPDISYFDPKGEVMPEELTKILRQVFPSVNTDPEIVVNPQIQFQWDNYNCGPWIVEILSSLIKSGGLPSMNFDIEAAREEHSMILNSEILTPETLKSKELYQKGRNLLSIISEKEGQGENPLELKEFRELTEIIEQLHQYRDDNGYYNKLAEKAGSLQNRVNNNFTH